MFRSSNAEERMTLEMCGCMVIEESKNLDKLKEVKTSWVLDGASSSHHSMIAFHTYS